MSLTDKEREKALQVDRAVAEHFAKSQDTKIQAKELMDLFIKEGIFDKNHRDGSPIRSLLRRLHECQSLSLITHAHFEQKDQNKNWFFVAK